MSAAMTWYGIDLNWAYVDLLGGIRRRTGCLQRAYDVLHESLISYALIQGRTQISEPKAYLRVVVRSVLSKQFQEAARWAPLVGEQGRAVDGGRGSWVDSGASEDLAPSPELLTELRQRLAAVQAVVDCLPPRCREVFWLFRIEGYTQPEIAKRLGISLNMVERHMIRALLDLRALREGSSATA